MATVLIINGKQVDLTAALPIKVKDWKALEKHGVSVTSLSNPSVEVLVNFVGYIAHKANPGIDIPDVDEMTMEELLQAVNLISVEKEKIDRPFSTSSTSSPDTTVGA